MCEVPPLLPPEPYLVAYSCMPQVLTPIRAVRNQRIVLFAKNVERWADFYSDCPNITVQPVGSAFQLTLARSSGLIASPSPGAVIQALGCSKPCFLFIPPGHLEQLCNYNYYQKHFVGVSSPLNDALEGWAERALAPYDGAPMLAQAQKVRDWLNAFEDAAHRTLVRSLRRIRASSAPGAVVSPGAEAPWPRAEHDAV